MLTKKPLPILTTALLHLLSASCIHSSRHIAGEATTISEPTPASNPFNNPSLTRAIKENGTNNEDLKSIAKTCSEEKSLQYIDDTPVDQNDPAQTKTFRYYYSHKIISPTAPTIVYLPGGPGGESIGRNKEFPEGYNLIFIDPRGVGCNYSDAQDYPAKYLGTQFATDDILRVIKHLNLDNYILYGASYGSVLATVLANKIEKQGITPPKGVLLEGVLGKAWGTWDEREQYGATISTRFIQENPKVKALLSDANHLPLGYSAEFWGDKLQYAGRLWDSSLDEMNRLYDYLNGDKSKADVLRKLERQNKEFTENYKLGQQDPMDRVFKQVACTELGRTMDNGIKVHYIVTGEMRLKNHPNSANFSDQCNQVTEPYTPYDSAQYPIHSPIVFINGETDTATPLPSARYHFENQRASSRKTFIEIDNGGHYPFSDMNLKCKEVVFNEIFSQRHQFSKALAPNGHCKL